MSRYLGVYDNKYTPTQEEFPYRVAIKRFVNGMPEYTNIGYFQREDTAGFIYNVYALTTFGKGAVINDIEMSDQLELEVLDYANNEEGFDRLLIRVDDVLEEHGHLIKVHSYQN